VVVPAQIDAGQKFLVQVVLTLLILGSSLFVILSGRYPPTDKQWAYGVTGTIFGYWMHSN
jgi:hypothetical protein